MLGRSSWCVVLAALLVSSLPAEAQSSSADSARLEPPGPCSRRTPLVISEIFYHPPSRADSNNLEFIELYNSQPWPEDLSEFRLTGAVQFTFPAGTRLGGDSVLVVAADPQAIRAVYGATNVLGPFAGRLKNNSEQVRLRNRSGAVLLELEYSAQSPWPVSPDGGGHSLVLARPSLGAQTPGAWAASDQIGGSPGHLEVAGPESLRGVMFNEILAHSTNPQLDFLELHNQSSAAADLSGCHLTDDPTTNKFTFPNGSALLPGGFLSLVETQLGFALHAAGETLYLLNPAGTRVLDVVRFGGQARDKSFGRVPDGGPWWSVLASRTAGLPNSAALPREVVINEIMYGPASREDQDQFVEIHNRGTNQIDLNGWRFVDGIEFTFPPNTFLAPGGYVAVVSDVARFQTRYPGPPAGRWVGNFSGKLSGRGERIALARPETVLSTNLGVIETNLIYCVVDEVSYGTGGRWPQWAHNGGSSLERVNSRGDGRLADQWADSDETAKAPWTTVEWTGRLDFGDGSSANALQLLLLGAGECLVDDVEVRDPPGNALLANSTFESGLAPWTPQGDHDTSFLQATGGVNNSRCLHVRALGDGDPGANRIRVPLTSPIPVGSNATLRARVRWLRGHPEILLRLGGNYLEAVGTLTVPPNLGTPGAPNSQTADNLGPSILAVQHQPIVPSSNQAVVVTARLVDPDGLGPAVLNYRVDPSNTVFTVPLLDDGSGGDALAGDGLFSATIPPQGGKLVAFYVRATDLHSSPSTRTFPHDAPARECLVRFGESQPAGKFGTYRLWATQATINQWTVRAKLSNAALDGTFVNGGHRAIYNAGMLYAGSAYHASRYSTPTGVACDYKLVFPADDLFLGSDEAVVVWPGLTAGDPVDSTAQQEQTSYWIASMLGLPFNYQRYVHLFVNGVRRSPSIMQDTQKPDRDSVRQWFPDDDEGELFKVQIWREYDASANTTTTAFGATLGNFTTVGGLKKTARYRWSWTPRATGKTMNSFGSLFELVDVVNSPSQSYVAAVESVIDIEQWMRTFAAEHVVCNWDSYGYGNGQNMYAYKPNAAGWKMMIWDMDVCLGNASDPATADLFRLANPFFPDFNGDAAIVDRMYKTPKFARAYWRAIQDAVNGPLAPDTLHPLLDAKSAAFAANGVSANAPLAIKSFLNARRNYCVGRLASVAAPFSLSSDAFLAATNNPVALSGTAPVEVRDIFVNGVPVPVTWTSVTSWTAQVTVNPGTNVLLIQGLDRLGNALENARATNTVAFSGPAVPHVTVLLNEWMASNTNPGGFPNPAGGAYDDWFELYNPSSAVANLAGYYLTDNLTDRFRYLIPPGYAVPPGGYLLVWADGEPARNHSQTTDLHVSFQLGKGGESIGLFAPDGTTIDSVNFGSQTNNISQGRWPDGGSGVHFMVVPTPGAANRLNGLTNAPMFTSAVLHPGRELGLTWRTIAGRTYHLEYKDQLDDEDWTALGAGYLANGSQFTLRLPIQPIGQRFYRIRQVDGE